jgi:endonuclease/exonuclease/phosphatase (EEP) superfamily protein YafD
MPSIATIITLGEQKIRLVGTHPLPPHNADTLAVQFAQLQAIGQFVSANPDVPAIVLGDFNATPWSPAINELRAKSTLDFRCRNAVWLPTWQVRTPLALPIDLALCTSPLFFEQRDIGPEVGSDHRAQVLQIRWAIYP